MSKFILVLSLLVACAATPPQPVAPHIQGNRAEAYALAVDPNAVCIRWGQDADGFNDAALCRSGGVLFYCATNPTKRTSCNQLADTNPKPAPQPQPSPVTAPQPPPSEPAKVPAPTSPPKVKPAPPAK